MYSEIYKYNNTPFEWGVNDCLLFSSAIAHSKTGKTLVEEFRGQYKTPKQALVLLKENGIEHLEEIYDHFFERIDKNFAKVGDIVLCENEGLLGMCFAIVNGVYAVVPGDDGLVNIARDQWITAWSVE